jgi:hypothetical protein
MRKFKDPRKEKLRDLRKAYMGAEHPDLWKIFAKQHPEMGSGKRRWSFTLAEWDEYKYWLARYFEWVQQVIGVPCWWLAGNCPARYRRDKNRQRRAKSRQMLRDDLQRTEWDDIIHPRFRNDANYDWF